MNDFGSICIILGELWFAYRDDEVFEKMLTENAAAFALAYSVSEDLATATPAGRTAVTSLWDYFLDQMLVDKEKLYVSLDDVLESIGSGEDD